MKTIGLLGGMSWQSTVGYYRMLNEGVQQRLGGLHSASVILHSVDFAPLEQLQQRGDWDAAAGILIDAAQGIERAGADCLLICTNTMHRIADQVEAAIQIPLLHIADATGQKLAASGIRRVGLLGTAFTMEQAFYKGRLADRFDLEVLVPDAAERQLVHRVIYQELCQGMILEGSKQQYLRVIEQLVEQGAEAVILGCTEIGLLVRPQDCPVRLLDTTAIHVEQALAFALAEVD